MSDEIIKVAIQGGKGWEIASTIITGCAVIVALILGTVPWIKERKQKEDKRNSEIRLLEILLKFLQERSNEAASFIRKRKAIGVTERLSCAIFPENSIEEIERLEKYLFNAIYLKEEEIESIGSILGYSKQPKDRLAVDEDILAADGEIKHLRKLIAGELK